MATSTQPTSRPVQVDADLKRRTEEFLSNNPVLSKKLDELDRLLMAHFLQGQLQDERNGWRGTLAKAIEELERHRRMSLKATDGEEYQLKRQFTDFMDDGGDGEKSEEPEDAASADDVKPAEAASDEAAEKLQAQLAEARDEASAAAELTWHYENFIRELKAINTKLEARLTQVLQERRRCLRLLPPLPGGPDGADLYRAIRELQNRHEQQTLEQQERWVPAEQPVCPACGYALTASSQPTPRSDGHPPQPEDRQPQQQQTGGAGSVVGWKRGRMFGNAGSSVVTKPAADIAIMPLRPPKSLEVMVPPQQPTTDPSLPERLAEAQAESGRLRKDLRVIAKALRAAEDDAKEKAERLAAYEKQVAAMKHAFTYRHQQPPEPTADSTTGSLPVLNLRHTHKRPSQQQQLQPSLSERHVMPAKTSVTRCLRCQKLYRLVDNNKFACKYHSKGKQRREQHNSQGKLADVLFVWDCCGRLANAEGCCYSEHI